MGGVWKEIKALNGLDVVILEQTREVASLRNWITG